jgi:hypothetical protein
MASWTASVVSEGIPRPQGPAVVQEVFWSGSRAGGGPERWGGSTAPRGPRAPIRAAGTSGTLTGSWRPPPSRRRVARGRGAVAEEGEAGGRRFGSLALRR